MRSTTALAQDNLAARIACWSLALIGLAGLVGCARGLDAGNLQCSNNGPCPAGYVCSSNSPSTPGHCVRPDGSANQSVSPGRDAELDSTGLEGGQAGGAGGSPIGGAHGSGGAGGGTPTPIDANQGGAGGGPMSGAGGIAGSAGSMAQAGAGGSPDAPIGSGGTASPDAPITSGPDAPTTLANGSTCTSNGQCTSTYCIDGVCCDKACTGCSACTLQLNGQQGSAKDGQCLPVVASQAPPTTHTPCATDPASPCGLDGLCDGNGACQHTAGGTRCATPSCSGSTLTSSACDSTSHTCTATNSPCSGSQACA
jgi:hypothetical protein